MTKQRFSTLEIRRRKGVKEAARIHDLDILINGEEPPGLRRVDFHTSINGINVLSLEMIVEDVDISAEVISDLELIALRSKDARRPNG